MKMRTRKRAGWRMRGGGREEGGREMGGEGDGDIQRKSLKGPVRGRNRVRLDRVVR